MKKEVQFENNKVDRRFTEEWSKSGFINMDRLPDLVGSVIAQRKEMIEYIEALHDTIDFIRSTNKCCDIRSCLKAGCTSSHK